MNKLVRIFLMALISGFCGTGILSAADESRALQMVLNQDAIDLLARELQSKHLKDIQDSPLEDVEEEVQLGIKARVEGISYDIDFNGLDLILGNRMIDARIRLKKISVHADRIKFRKRVLGQQLRSTCTDTDIVLEGGSMETLKARLKPEVIGDEMTAEISGVDFDVDEDDFEVDGPDRCTGDLGVGHLIRFVVEKVLNSARERMIKAIRDRIEDLGPSFADMTNENLRREFNFKLNLGPMEEAELGFKTYPTLIALSEEALRFELGVDVLKKLENKSHTTLGLSSEGAASQIRVGVNPMIMTEMADKLREQWDGHLPLSAEQSVALKEVLSVRSAAAMWPDLNQRSLAGDQLNLLVKFLQAPRFVINEQEDILEFNWEGLEFLFQIPTADGWRDYFTMRMDLQGALTVSTDGAVMAVEWSRPSTLQISGDWAEGIHADPAIFEQDVAETLFLSIFDYLFARGPLYRFEVPEFSLGDQQLQVSRVVWEAPFIALELGP